MLKFNAKHILLKKNLNIDLNTSHVKVQQLKLKKTGKQIFNLNTSHVKVQL